MRELPKYKIASRLLLKTIRVSPALFGVAFWAQGYLHEYSVQGDYSGGTTR
jgi:hypothetical protein